MKSIETVGVIGLGALGVLYADQFTQALGKDRVFVLADRQRTDRYCREGVWYNDELCDFNYADAAQITQPVDLLLFAVKFGGLDTAADTCRHLVGPDTILLSVLNGITSEEVLGRASDQRRWSGAWHRRCRPRKRATGPTATPPGNWPWDCPPARTRRRWSG